MARDNMQRHWNRFGRRWLTWASLVTGLSLSALAAKGPGPGVARLSLMQGKVSLLQAGSQSWQDAVVNTPLVAGDSVYLAGAGRAEVQFDRNDVLQMAGHTELSVTRFRDSNLQMQMKLGTLTFSRFEHAHLQTEIDTPNMSLRPLGTSEVRVDVVNATTTSVTVRHGSALVWTSQGQVTVKAGKQIQISGSDNPQYRVVDAPARDSWDRWVSRRDEALLRSPANRYLNGNIYGGNDLDRYGHWVWVPNYGQVWQPWEAAGWSPYYDGRWIWLPDYGWTWVSYEPWGWAPYHYGRWFYSAGAGWCWWPGPYYGANWWAPAYVNFFYAGAGWGIGFGFGGGPCIGWLPLAPYEPYYGYTQVNYITNVTNVTYINNVTTAGGQGPTGIINGRKMINGTPLVSRFGLKHMKNYGAPGGVVAITTKGFANGSVAKMGRRLSHPALTRVGFVRGTAPVAPTRASFRVLPGARPAPRPPASLSRVRVFQHTPVRVASHNVPLARLHHSISLAQTHFNAQAGLMTHGRIAGRTIANTGTRLGSHGHSYSNTGTSVASRGRTFSNSGQAGAPRRNSGSRSFAINHASSGNPSSGWRRFGAGSATENNRSGSGSVNFPRRPTGIPRGSNRGTPGGNYRGSMPGGTRNQVFMNHPEYPSQVTGSSSRAEGNYGGRNSSASQAAWGRRVSPAAGTNSGYSRSSNTRYGQRPRGGTYGYPSSGYHPSPNITRPSNPGGYHGGGYRPAPGGGGGYRPAPSGGGYRPTPYGGGYHPSGGGGGGYHAPAAHSAPATPHRH